MGVSAMPVAQAEIGEKHERVANVRRAERPAGGEQPGADERHEDPLRRRSPADARR